MLPTTLNQTENTQRTILAQTLMAEKQTTGNMRHVQLAGFLRVHFVGWRRKRLIRSTNKF
ncbi:MAG TPA: hypothetical protein DFK21_01010 [Salmonella bongori]|nr:hypothetical protein [Salmonella bongori]ECI3518444.1 hypothetical protein [Salmonella bongori]HAD92429.1 hypothetical protein [Salmonella bongori]HCI32151.1 hypothetical protein [Salmonella bongori]HCI40163.1 hypothetical protein [Salmonella bongori]